MSLESEIDKRLEHAGVLLDVPHLHLLSDVLRIVADEMDGWTGRCDDAKRIPDVIGGAAETYKNRALKLSEVFWNSDRAIEAADGKTTTDLGS